MARLILQLCRRCEIFPALQRCLTPKRIRCRENHTPETGRVDYIYDGAERPGLSFEHHGAALYGRAITGGTGHREGTGKRAA